MRQTSLPDGLDGEDGKDGATATTLLPPGGIVGSPDTSAVPFRGMTKSMTLSGQAALSSIPSSATAVRPGVTFGTISVGGPSLKVGGASSTIADVSIGGGRHMTLGKPAFKRVQSVAGIDSFKKTAAGAGETNYSTLDAMLAASNIGVSTAVGVGGGGGGPSGDPAYVLDDRARSQLAQNVW